MLIGLVLVSFSVQQGATLPLDESVFFELAAEDASGGEGEREEGFRRRFSFVPEFTGRLSVWARSDALDPVLELFLHEMGDLTRSRELGESLLEAQSRELEDDHTMLQRTRQNLALVLKELEQPEEARKLEEVLLEVYSATLPEDHSDLLLAQNNLAGTLYDLEEFGRARDLFEAVLEVRSAKLPPDHRDVIKSRHGLGFTLFSLGELERARSLQRETLELLSGSLPEEHPDVRAARLNLAWTLVALGDHSGCREQVDALLRVLAIGGADYSADLPAEVEHRGVPAELVRSGDGGSTFVPLPGTLAEVERISALWQQTFDEPVRVLTGARATRTALLERASGSRYLHIATHGWFAPDSVASDSDGDSVDRHVGLGRSVSLADHVRGASPMTLCGLALAGIDREAGRVRGAVTAEELATLDLTGCELAVLSACETNVGERRHGQGVASLQRALHRAGARTVVTSLWKVSDEATSELMVDFYRRLWIEEQPVHRALWEAKRRLRDARKEDGSPRYGIRDWAGWVVTGPAN